MKFKKLFLWLCLLGASASVRAENLEDLPELLDINPKAPFDILGPVGAGKKTIEEAREQLRREAKKMDASAVASVRCEPGGMSRDGLNFFRKDAYCRGYAIRFKEAPKDPVPPPAPVFSH